MLSLWLVGGALQARGGTYPVVGLHDDAALVGVRLGATASQGQRQPSGAEPYFPRRPAICKDVAMRSMDKPQCPFIMRSKVKQAPRFEMRDVKVP